MTVGQAPSDIDDRTNSALSTSSHTHVDHLDARQQSPRHKMTEWSAKRPEEHDLPHEHPASMGETAERALALDTHASRGPTSTREPSQAVPARPPPPACMQSCIASIDACTRDIVRFNERIENNRVQAEAQRQESGDPVVARKAIIPLVFVILSWVFLVYVWRLCSQMIQQTPQGVALGGRSEGIGLLVGFVILWLMAIWSYVTVISKGPGYVKDYVTETPPPLVAAGPGQWAQGHAPHTGVQPQHATKPWPIPTQNAALPSEGTHPQSQGVGRPDSLPYPSFNADLERFGGYRASSDSMRVLPGSVEPKHETLSGDLSHSRGLSQRTIAEEEDDAADTSAVDVEAQLKVESTLPADGAEPSTAEVDPQLPGLVGPLAAAAVAEGEGMREATEAFERQPAIVGSGPDSAAPQPPAVTAWAAPQRQPANDPPPLSAAAQYCHRCRRVKPPRAHHCRRCGMCVLKMDHHCPWVGGCVGAHNQRFFFIFVLWVTLLEVYTLATTATYFHRGVRSLGPGSAWRVDGFLISLFPICAVFVIFTGALLGTHVFLMAHNMTTIEHVGVNRVQGRERVLVDRWFGMQATKNIRSADKPRGLGANLKAKRTMIREWDREWGALTTHGNRWWLGSSSEADQPTQSTTHPTEPDRTSILAAQEKHHGATKPTEKKHGAAWTNTSQALGESVWMWFLPIGKHPNEGLDFPMNPRFGPQGIWRRRSDWPQHLQ